MTTAAADAVPFITRDEVERRAAEVLRAYSLDAIPVDLIALADRLGMAVHNATFSDDTIVGMIAKRGTDVTVLVNATDPPFRKRFTIAHELGHYFLHLPGDGEFVDGEVNLFRGAAEDQTAVTPDRRREIQANMFAAALLMPEPAVRAEWKNLGSVGAMARRFNVSEAAMGIRVVQLGLA